MKAKGTSCLSRAVFHKNYSDSSKMKTNCTCNCQVFPLDGASIRSGGSGPDYACECAKREHCNVNCTFLNGKIGVECVEVVSLHRNVTREITKKKTVCAHTKKKFVDVFF